MVNVRDILRSKADQKTWTITPFHTVYEAVKLMSEKNIGALVVVDRGVVVGLISERDYLKKIMLANKTSQTTKVEEIMTKEVIYVVGSDTVDGCMALMTENRVRHLPVIEEGNLLGMVSIGDAVKAIISDKEFLIDQLVRYITGSPFSNQNALEEGKLEEAESRFL